MAGRVQLSEIRVVRYPLLDCNGSALRDQRSKDEPGTPEMPPQPAME